MGFVLWCTLVAGIAIASPTPDALQPVSNLQKVVLTGREPEVLDLPPLPKPKAFVQAGVSSRSESQVDVAVPQHPESAEPTRWFTREQLLDACGIPPCNAAAHCFGNPTSFPGPAFDTTKPDGTHHEVCCAMVNPIDIATDSTKIVHALDECHTNKTSGGFGWCIASDRNMTTEQRCIAHGGVPVWNYHQGRISAGATPNGRCLSLQDAYNRFRLTLDSDYYRKMERGGCTGKTGGECCGVGKCVWKWESGWGCEFDEGYDVKLCFPDPVRETGPIDVAELLKNLAAALKSLDALRDRLVATSNLASNSAPNSGSNSASNLASNSAPNAGSSSVSNPASNEASNPNSSQDSSSPGPGLTPEQMAKLASILDSVSSCATTQTKSLDAAFPSLVVPTGFAQTSANNFNVPLDTNVPPSIQEIMSYISTWSSTYADQLRVDNNYDEPANKEQ